MNKMDSLNKTRLKNLLLRDKRFSMSDVYETMEGLQ